MPVPVPVPVCQSAGAESAPAPAFQGMIPTNTFSEQVSKALAIKLNLKTKQHADKNALAQLVKSKSLTGGLKQALQARVAVYDSLLSPS